MGKRQREEAGTLEAEIDSVNSKSLEQFIEEYMPPSEEWATWQDPRSGEKYGVSVQTAESLSSEDFAACFELIRTTSSVHYKNSSVGWKVRAKKLEMTSEELKYVLVRKEGQKEIAAFLSLMPTMEDDCAVLYCYEIHLVPELQGSGLGAVLMDLFEKVAQKILPIDRTMLSCFIRNERAVKFYRKRRYQNNDMTPSPKILRTGAKIEPDYIIMSKVISRESQN